MDCEEGPGEKKAKDKGPAGRAGVNRGDCGWRGEGRFEGFLRMTHRIWWEVKDKASSFFSKFLNWVTLMQDH